MSSTDQSPARMRILLGVTGSVAAVKAPEIAVQLVNQLGAQVKVLLTTGGKNFWDKAQEYNPTAWNELMSIIMQEPSWIQIHHTEEEWRNWNRLGDSVMHIDLRDWADLLVIAPLSAHTLAKVSHGLCDDVLSSVVRAWDFGHGVRPGKPIVLAPAMNTAMWQHPLTQPQLETIQGFWNANQRVKEGIFIVSPQVKELACGEVGNGALASVEQIVQVVKQASPPMAGGVGFGGLAFGLYGASSGSSDNLRDLVLNYIREEGDRVDEGANVRNCIQALTAGGRHSESAVRQTIDELATEGHIYSTIKEDNYKFAVY